MSEQARWSSERGAGFDDVYSIGLVLVPPRGRVLDVGCGDGAVAQLLASQGCKVWGVERDKSLAERASLVCDKVIVGDLDVLELDELGEDPFDTILCLDVLAHLVDPVEVLRRLSTRLAPHGRVVASFTNVGHGAARLTMLKGALPAEASGLFDPERLHLYDRRTADELFRDAGLEVVEIYAVRRGLHDTELDVDGDWPDEILDMLADDPDAHVYQFVVTASLPNGQPATASPVEELVAALLRHDEALAASTAQAAEIRRQLSDSERAALAFQAERHELEARAAAADEMAGDLKEELRARLDEIDLLRRDLVRLERALSVRDDRFAELQRGHADVVAARDELEARVAQLDARLLELDGQRGAAAAEIEKIKAWPAYRALERYEHFRHRHARLVAPFRWLARRMAR